MLLLGAACSPAPDTGNTADGAADRWTADGIVVLCAPGDSGAARNITINPAAGQKGPIEAGACSNVGESCESSMCSGTCEPWFCACEPVDGSAAGVWICQVPPYTP